MLPALFDHVWQSTLFAAVAGLLTLVLRKNRAQIRYHLWLAASVKFLVPFSILVAVGGHFGKPTAPAATASSFPFIVEKVGEPFAGTGLLAAPPPSKPSSANLMPEILGALWATGFLILVGSWWRRWLKIRSVLRTATSLQWPIGVRAMSSRAFLEPGVFGIFRPILLLPDGIASRLTPQELEAILAHEQCHIRRRDNLATALHMVVEAVFWFYPRIWWIGAHLIKERGHDPETYAESILKISELYLTSQLPCVAGVTGGNLKRRIEDIMHSRTPLGLTYAKQSMLALAGTAALAVPVVFGVMNAPAAHAQASPSPTAAIPKWEVVSIKLCAPGTLPSGAAASAGRLTQSCMSVMALINQSYVMYSDGNLHMPGPRLVPIERGPEWIKSDSYRIEAKAEGTPRQEMMQGPMLQALLEDRFKLKIRSEFRQVPVYALTVAKGGPKLQAAQEGSCRPLKLLTSPTPAVPGQQLLPCKMGIFTKGAYSALGVTMAEFGVALSSRLDRDVIDRTGIQGVFDIRVPLPGFDETLGLSAPAPPPGARVGPSVPANPPDSLGFLPAAETVAQKLGLKLDSADGPGRFLVIDHVERPSDN